MAIPVNVKTPGTYINVNINTQRTGLPNNNHQVLFITDDIVDLDFPVDIYDAAQADAVFGTNSKMGRMMKAAVKSNQTVNVQAVGK